MESQEINLYKVDQDNVAITSLYKHIRKHLNVI